jgi:hypothetical protein
MPLTRAPGTVRVDLNRVVFPMQDVATGTAVRCVISEQALRKLSGGASSIAALDALFDQHRDEIEAMASRKYDAGMQSPFIIRDDV